MERDLLGSDLMMCKHCDSLEFFQIALEAVGKNTVRATATIAQLTEPLEGYISAEPWSKPRAVEAESIP